MVKIFLFLIGFSYTLSLIGQEIGVKEIIISSRDNPVLKAQQNTIDYLNNKSFRLPFFDKITLRLRTQGLYYQPHQYQLNFKNNSIAMMRAQYKSSLVLKDIENYEYQIINLKEYKDRYNAIVDVYFQNRKDTLLLELTSLLNDKKKYFIQEVSMGASTKFDFIVEIDDDLFKYKAETIQNKENNTESLILLSILTGKQIAKVNFDDFISLDKIIFTMNQLSEESTETLEMRKKKLEIGLQDWKRKSLIRENYKILNNWQVSYEDSLSKNDFLETRINIGVSLLIPVPNTNKIKIQNAKLDVLSAEKKYAEEKFETAIKMKELQLKLNKEWKMILAQKNQLNEFNVMYDISKLASQSGIDAYFLYKVKSAQLKKRYEIEKNLNNVYKTYIELMDVTGSLGLKNCLSNGLEELSN